MFRRALPSPRRFFVESKPKQHPKQLGQRIRRHRRGLFLESLEQRHLLSVTFNEVEANDTLATGQVVQSPGLTSVVDMITPSSGSVAEVATATNPDFYRFVAAIPGDLKVDVLNLGGNPDGDLTTDTALKISIFNQADVQVGASQTINVGGTASFTVQNVNTTDVFKAQVEGDVAGNDAQYQIRIWYPDVNDDTTGSPANNDTRANATVLTLSPTNTGTFSNFAIHRPDRDYYSFVAQATGPIEVRVQMPAGTGTASPQPTNLGIRIRDAAGAIIASSNASQTNVDVASFSAVSGNTYFAEVYSGSVGQVNKYDLQFSPPSGQISGFKYHDLNQNGFQDLNEPGLANWAIYADANNNSVLDNPTSGNGVCDGFATEICALSLVSTGAYSLTLPAGLQRIREVPQSGWAQTYPGAEDAGFHSINIQSSIVLDHIDFGNVQLASITIVKDAVPNGTQSFVYGTTGAGLSTFTLDDDGVAANPFNNSQTFTGLLPGGARTITEGVPVGFTITNIVCSGAVSSTVLIGGDNDFDLGDNSVTITLAPGENVSCIFENTKLGTITINKDAVPNDAQDFPYTTSGVGVSNFTLDDDTGAIGANGTFTNSQSFTGLLPGTRTITETSQPGFTITNIICSGATLSTVQIGSDSDFDPGDISVSINLAAGETVSCTFENTKHGTITIDKDAVPNDAQDFPYTAAGVGVSNFTLDDDAGAIGANGTFTNSQSFSGLLPGTRTITETSQPGFTITNIVCSGATLSTVQIGSDNDFDAGDNSVSINLAAGESVSCVFENTKHGSITINKDAVPNDAQDFAYVTSGVGVSNFTLDDDAGAIGANGTFTNSQAFTGLLPGTRTITESPLTGFTITNIICSGATLSTVLIGSDNDFDAGDNSVSITLAAGESVSCVFENTKHGTITINKDSVPNDAQDFPYTVTGVGVSNFMLDDDAAAIGADGTFNNSQSFTGLLPGTRTITEASQPGFTISNIVCSGAVLSTVLIGSDSDFDAGDSGVSINLAAGESVSCVFENTKQAGITIVKDSVPNDAQDFAYTTTGTGISNFTLDDDAGALGADGTFTNSQTFSPLTPGLRTITESPVAGFTITNIICSGATLSTVLIGIDSDFDAGDNGVSINLVAGESVSCIFENTKHGTITIDKDAVPNDAQDFPFAATGAGVSNFTLDDDAGAIGANGTFTNSQSFTGLLPGARTITETSQPGFTITNIVCSGAVLSTVLIGSDSDFDAGDNSVSIGLAAGESVSCVFENTKHGSITINKDAVPNDAEDFPYTVTGVGVSNFTLDDDAAAIGANGIFNNSQSFTGLLPGTRTFTESTQPGFTISNIICGGATLSTVLIGSDSDFDAGDNSVSITLAAGENVSCVFENTKQGSITITKNALPNHAQDFAYTTTGTGLSNFTLDDDAGALGEDAVFSNSQTFSPLTPGVRTITEVPTTGFTITNIVCSGAVLSTVLIGSDSDFDPGDDSVSINLAAGEGVTCTFENTKQGSITVIKDAVPDDGQNFEFDPSNNLQAGNFFLDDDTNITLSNTQVFNGLLPGNYTVEEVNIPPGWQNSNIGVSGASSFTTVGSLATINLATGEDVVIIFTDIIAPAFSGRKFLDVDLQGDQDVGDSPLPGWTIEVYRDDGDGVFEPNVPAILGGDGGVYDDPGDSLPPLTAVTDAQGNYNLGRAQTLPTSTYFIREILITGWQRTTPAAFHTVAYVNGTTVGNPAAVSPGPGNLNFGNSPCADRMVVGNGTVQVFSERDGVLTIELFSNTPFTVTSGTPFQVYNPGTGSLSPAALTGNSRVSEFDATHQRIDIRTTGAGVLFNVNISGLSGTAVLRRTNSVNVAIATSLALQITGGECGELIVVRDDKAPDGIDPDSLPDEVGTPSDAKWIFIGGFSGTLNGGAPLTAEGIRYNTAIINGVFGTPSISRIEINSLGGDDYIRVGSELTVQQSTINGGTGDDTIRAGDQKATISGGDGNDFAWGGASDDILNGDNGQDWLFGGAGADRANGLAGNDVLGGGIGDDPLLRGGDGDDSVSGGSGADRLLGENNFDRGYRDVADVFYSGFEVTKNIPPDPDDVENFLNNLFDNVWDDSFVADGDNADGNDTLEELINSLYP